MCVKLNIIKRHRLIYMATIYRVGNPFPLFPFTAIIAHLENLYFGTPGPICDLTRPEVIWQKHNYFLLADTHTN